MKRAALFPLAFVAGVLVGWAMWLAVAIYHAYKQYAA